MSLTNKLDPESAFGPCVCLDCGFAPCRCDTFTRDTCADCESNPCRCDDIGWFTEPDEAPQQPDEQPFALDYIDDFAFTKQEAA
jgi:hypothetical protein